MMAALKLKEQWDDYRRVPSEEDGTGAVALHSPVDEEATLTLDTEIPMTRPKRKRADCCMCCGMRCGLFWKAFGLVCLLLVGWNAIKFVIWMATPSPTGLEGMPEFSTSLNCASAPHMYLGGKIGYSVPVDALTADHTLEITGSSVGTIVVAQGDAESTELKYDMTIRSEAQSPLEQVSVKFTSPTELEEGISKSRMHLITPSFGSSCIRYDMTVYVPPNVKELSIQTRGAAQIQFDEESNFNLDKLYVRMTGVDEKTMLLPHKGVHAGALSFEMNCGWLVGDVAIVDKASLTTQGGDAVLNVHVFPAPSTVEPPAVAELQTTTGSGRADVFYINHPGHPHRSIFSTHRGQSTGDLYLTYKEAGFNGSVDVTAKSSTAVGLQGMVRNAAGELPWVGDKDGSDKLVANSPSGWVGLYF